jgi:PAS domain S-box-containing protein
MVLRGSIPFGNIGLCDEPPAANWDTMDCKLHDPPILMRKPDIPDKEAERLADLFDYEILDTASELVFDEIAQLAATISGAPYALITLVDRNRQWMKAEYGIALGQTARDDSICAHAILEHEFFEVPDLKKDGRFADNPVLNGIRFYGGSQLTSMQGHNLGMLCVLDSQPRELSAAQRHALEQLADVVVALLEARRQYKMREWFGNLIDSVADEICVADAQTLRYLHANASAVRHLGYPLEQLRKLTPIDVMPNLTRQQLTDYIQQMRDGAPQIIYESARRRDNGEVYPVEVRWQLLVTGGRVVVVSLIQDISERKAIERMKDEFISVVNHELRTPLTSIHGAVKLLEAGAAGPLPDAAARLVRLASDNTARLRSIIDDILDLDKIVSGRMDFDIEPLDAAAMLEKVAQAHEATAGSAGVKIAVAAPPGLCLLADAQRLHQVLDNLVSNALKFAPPGTQVLLQAQPDTAGPKVRVRLSVTDHGSGIPEDFRDRIFQRFAQADMNTSRQKGGSGLGLAIVKKMVEQMNGSVDYESRPGLTTFRVGLPGPAA